jgi:hypothetical protein
MSTDKLTITEALRIVSAVVMVATGTKESDIAAELRPSALSLDVIYASLVLIRDICNTSHEVIEISLPGAPCMHGFAAGACAECQNARITMAHAAKQFDKNK